MGRHRDQHPEPVGFGLLDVPLGRQATHPRLEGAGLSGWPGPTPQCYGYLESIENIGQIRVAEREVTSLSFDEILRGLTVRFLQDSAVSGESIKVQVSTSAPASEDIRLLVSLVTGEGDNPAVPGEDYLDEPVGVTISQGTTGSVATLQLLRNDNLTEARSLSVTVSSGRSLTHEQFISFREGTYVHAHPYVGSTHHWPLWVIILIGLAILSLPSCGGGGSSSGPPSMMIKPPPPEPPPPEEGRPDLVIQSNVVSDDTLTPGQQFTLSVTVRNQGDGQSAATTLRYKRHARLPIVMADPTQGTDAVTSLSPSGTSSESISLTAPSTPGTYHYGACVDSVNGESNTGNNCSGDQGIRVTVGEITSPTPPSGANPIRDVNVSIPSSCPTEVQVCVRDHQCEDGDIARVAVNGRLVFSGELFNQWSCHNAPVQAGRNVVEFLAVNGTGFKGQCNHSNVNTGQLRIVGGNTGRTQTWSHAGGAGSQANLNVVVGPPGGTCTPRGSLTPTPPPPQPPPPQTNWGAIYYSRNGAWALRVREGYLI